MTGFVEQLRLAEKAAEDIYFAKLNRELIEALHRRKLAKHLKLEKSHGNHARLGSCHEHSQPGTKMDSRC
mgnify:CR=1 FL=1